MTIGKDRYQMKKAKRDRSITASLTKPTRSNPILQISSSLIVFVSGSFAV